MSKSYSILDVDAVNLLLRRFVMEVLSLPEDFVLIETRMRPRPYDDKPYVTIYWKDQELLPQFDGDMEFIDMPQNDPNSPSETISDPGLVDGSCLEVRRNTAHCTARFTVRGENAYNLASELRYALESANRNFDLWGILGFSGCTGPMDLSAIYGAQTQQRAHVELSFYAPFGRRYELDYFSSVPFIINKEQYIYPKEHRPCPQLP